MGRLRLCFAALLAAQLLGCASGPQPQGSPLPPNGFPSEARVTQRAILTVHGRQIVLTGYVLLSEVHGKRLIVTQQFGRVLADIVIEPDRTVHIVRFGTPLREAWVRGYVVADFECIFGNAHVPECADWRIRDGTYAINRGRYQLDLRTVEMVPGSQAEELFKPIRAANP